MANATVLSADVGPLSRKAIAYLDTNTRLAGRAKQPDFRPEEWDELAALVAVEDYERVSANKGSRSWQEDMAQRSQWAALADFDSEVRRIKEVGNLVYLDMVEKVIANGETNMLNALAVFEFNAAGKLRRLTTYQQLDPGSPLSR